MILADSMVTVLLTSVIVFLLITLSLVVVLLVAKKIPCAVGQGAYHRQR